MRATPPVLRYPVALVTGICFVTAVWGVARAVGHADAAHWVDLVVGLLGLAFGISLLTGLNLGVPLAIKSTSGPYSPQTSPRAGLWLVAFSLPALVVSFSG